MALIFPSLLEADFARLGEGLEVIRRAGASAVHIDVCDGHFAPGITLGPPVIAGLRRATGLTLDVRLLVDRPERFVTDLAAAGANRIAIHPEATHQLYRVIRLIRESGALAGAALDPGMPLDAIRDMIEELDFLTLVCAVPGESEARLIQGAASKMRAAREMRAHLQARCILQAEGTVPEHVREMIEAGAEIIVPGSAAKADDWEGQLRRCVQQAARTAPTGEDF
ncbi:MAG: ribulose-phosphate 3-epimerase [Terriglobia bacterium]